MYESEHEDQVYEGEHENLDFGFNWRNEDGPDESDHEWFQDFSNDGNSDLERRF